MARIFLGIGFCIGYGFLFHTDWKIAIGMFILFSCNAIWDAIYD